MRIAVLTMTRDRLDYTKKSFASLRENAGCDFDHFVWDNGSTDETPEWLRNEYLPDSAFVSLGPDNIGICRAANKLLDLTKEHADYDVFVRFDNDCEVVRPGILRQTCEIATGGFVVAPKVLGLLNPPGSIGEFIVDGVVIQETGVLGGVFMAIPRAVFDAGYKFPEDGPKWGGDESALPWWREQGGRGGYLRDWHVFHHTEKHNQDYPDYYQRKLAEIGR